MTNIFQRGRYTTNQIFTGVNQALFWVTFRVAWIPISNSWGFFHSDINMGYDQPFYGIELYFIINILLYILFKTNNGIELTIIGIFVGYWRQVDCNADFAKNNGGVFTHWVNQEKWRCFMEISWDIYIIIYNYTGWWFQTWLLFSIIYIYIWDVILPIDVLTFFKMVKLHHLPVYNGDLFG